MKSKGINKKSIYIFLLVVILGANVLLIKYPEKIGYQYTLDEIAQKNSTVASIESSLKQKEQEIETGLEDINRRNDEKDKILIKSEKMRRQVNSSSFNLHFPSLLIDLEKNANISNVDLVIDYKNMKGADENNKKDDKPMDDGQVPPIPPEGDGILKENNLDVDIDKKTEDVFEDGPKGGPEVEEVVDKEKELLEKEKETGKDLEKPKEEVVNKTPTVDIPQIPGIKVVTIPLTIKGTYKNIREYVKFLDKVEMLEPSVVDITSDGVNISAAIIINVFYGEAN